MKAYMLLCLALIGASLGACSQNLTAKETPALVQNSLKARYPAVTQVEWEKKNNLFEAEFTIDQQDYSVLIDAAGTITMVKQDIAFTDLPAAIAEVIEKEYAAYTLDDSEKIEKGGQVFYQVELEKSLWDKNLVFTANGQKATSQAYWD
jgi:hypothetical protein